MRTIEQVVESYLNRNKSDLLKHYKELTPQGKVDFIEHLYEYYESTGVEIMRYLLVTLA